MSELTDLDGRLIGTLRRLVFDPGALTLDWIGGRRASAVSPLRLYLLSSALLFGLLAVPGLSFGASAVSGSVDAVIDGWYRDQGLEPPARLNELAEDNAALGRLAGDLFETVPRAMFLLLPAAALLVQLAFRKSGLPYVAHLVLALHVHTLVYLALFVLLPLDLLRGTPKLLIAYPAFGLFVLWLAWHTIRSSARVYGRSYLHTLGSLAVVTWCYSFLLFGAAVGLAALVLQ